MGRVSVRGVSRKFVKDDISQTLALDNIDLDIEDKEFVCFIGPSGCGKTTLLRIISGLDKPDSGEVFVGNEKITSPGPKRGMVFQEYSLFPWKSVINNVMFGPLMRGINKEKAQEEAEKYLELVGLTQFKDSYPHELSGGMKQRVAIARALANEPEVLLMDEPFGALDAQTRNSLQHELLSIWQKNHLTVLFVTHSVDEAVFLADRIVMLTARPGKIKDITRVNIPRPRDRTSMEVNQLRNHLLKLLAEEQQKK
ncbi:MAG: ABC transporter ATP-binding protein [Methanolobus sp.]|nr:ABC transporter ATP-binding protein [Methanolobus sp.]